MPNIGCEGRDFEGFGLTAVETAADQGVLLAARIDGITDAVIDRGTGFLLPPEDADSWAARIHEIAEWSLAERRAFVLEAFELARREYSWARVAERTLDAYAAAAGPPSPAGNR
jgi:glycosyltransferase involved in cell wall biosynthesis